MANVSDGFLLGLSEVVGTLMGFLLVGAFFYIQRGRGNLSPELWDELAPALRAVVRWVLLMYAFALSLSLGLVVLSPLSARVLFAVAGLVLVTSVIDLTHHYRIVKSVVRLPKRESAFLAWLLTAAILVPPWIWGGLEPNRSEMTVAALVAVVVAFLVTLEVLLSPFEPLDVISSTPSGPDHPLHS